MKKILTTYLLLSALASSCGATSSPEILGTEDNKAHRRFNSCQYEVSYTIDPLIAEAVKKAQEGRKVAVFLDMDRTTTTGINSNPNYELTPGDIRDGVREGIETLIENGCLVSILTARGNGAKIEAQGNMLLHRYPTDLAKVLGPRWQTHKAFNFEEDFTSKPLVVNSHPMKNDDDQPFYITYDSRQGHGSFIYGGGRPKKGSEYGVKGGVIVSLIMENTLKFHPDYVLFGDNAAFNIYEVRRTLEQHCIQSTVFHIPMAPGTQKDQADPMSNKPPHGDDKVFSSWEELEKSKGQ